MLPEQFILQQEEQYNLSVGILVTLIPFKTQPGPDDTLSNVVYTQFNIVYGESRNWVVFVFYVPQRWLTRARVGRALKGGQVSHRHCLDFGDMALQEANVVGRSATRFLVTCRSMLLAARQ